MGFFLLIYFRIAGMAQEIGKIQANNGDPIDFKQFPIGSRLYLYPYHVGIR